MKNHLINRSKKFALDVMEMVEFLPKSATAKIISFQLVKSATSVGANYRAVCRARSDKEFVSKMQIVLEESDESGYWLELIQAKGWADVSMLIQESNELVAIFVSSLKTVKARTKASRNQYSPTTDPKT